MTEVSPRPSLAPTAAVSDGPTVVGLGAVIVAVTEEVPRVLIVRRGAPEMAGAAAAQRPSPLVLPAESDRRVVEALPFGPFDPAAHRTLEKGLRNWMVELTGLELRWVEQLYTFGDRWRDPGELAGGPRVLTVAYLALTREQAPRGSAEARWQDWYAYLPWEDWRDGRPPTIDDPIRTALQEWIAAADDDLGRRGREERVGIAFGFGAAPWDPLRTLERYELLYEAGLVREAVDDRAIRERFLQPTTTVARIGPAPMVSTPALSRLGVAMALDDRRILATALGRLRGKLAYRPVVFDLVPEAFTLLHLQQVVEALVGQRLHKQNFRRMLAAGELVEPTGRVEQAGRGRPAELHRFRRAVLRAKPSAGVAVPTRRGGP